jgi:hypothetical protein
MEQWEMYFKHDTDKKVGKCQSKVRRILLKARQGKLGQDVPAYDVTFVAVLATTMMRTMLVIASIHLAIIVIVMPVVAAIGVVLVVVVFHFGTMTG